ncbi:WD40 repeat-like protein [Trichodelitschia bisporula]|uniref:WD40 repeat-like protein n=1 Tax=Trichodelitschia bisporula TaxID=703511 RepID=A0A6G1HYM0_9PEZI|nr:WD40 repeat-like protein [Trichodelitschia bisporula]
MATPHKLAVPFPRGLSHAREVEFQPPTLGPLDPKKYPLAELSTPGALRQFTFDKSGQSVIFREVISYTNYALPLPDALGKRSGLNRHAHHSNASGELPEPFLAIAAELVSGKRRTRRQRRPNTRSSRGSSAEPSRATHSWNTKFDESPPATPDAGSGVDRKPLPKEWLRARKVAARQPSALSRSAKLTSDEPVDPILPISTTPPLVESDLETATTPEIEAFVRSHASLPSPSLSPITAAASLDNLSEEEQGDIDTDDVASIDIIQNLPKFETGAPEDTPEDVRSDMVDKIPEMLANFDSFPPQLQTYVMYQLLRRCQKPTLSLVADMVNPALKVDFLTALPVEMGLEVLKHLDVQSMCRAAQVSKKWRQIVDGNETYWRERLEREKFIMPEGEVERAVREGWGWQFSSGPNSCERNLSPEESLLGSFKSSTGVVKASSPSLRSSKRKAAPERSSRPAKRRKTKSVSNKDPEEPDWKKLFQEPTGPLTHASAAALAVPEPDVGLPSLRQLHLYKSLYQRHYSIRKAWMDPEAKPRHFAFRAHGRHVVTCLQFDKDKILTGSDDTKINVYSTSTGKLLRTLVGHDGGVWALQYDGNTLVSGSTDRSVRVWDINTGECTQVFHGHTSTVRCLVIVKPTVVGHTAKGVPIMMPKQPLIITGSRDSTLRVWKLPQAGDGMEATEDNDQPYFVRALNGHHQSVRAIAAHGDTLVSGSYDSTVRVWRISTGDVLHRLIGHTQKVYSVVLDTARNRCISGSMDNLVKVWSIETGQCIFNLEGHTSLVGLLDLGHERLVSAAADSTLRIWDPESGQCKGTLSAHTGAITCFQHDAHKVISGSDRTLKLWNLKSGECVKDLLTDLSGVWQVRFDERRCVAAVQRQESTYIEVLDFGAGRDGVPITERGIRKVVDIMGKEISESEDENEMTDTEEEDEVVPA